MGIPLVGGPPLAPLMPRGHPSVAARQPVMHIKGSVNRQRYFHRLQSPGDKWNMSFSYF